MDTILYPNWTKILNLETELRLTEFSLHTHFRHVANIVEDHADTRQTVIRFEPVIDRGEWKKKSQWIYMLVIDGRIVKIGGTRTGLEGRCGSYLCGHHIPERGGSRDCSKTNGYIYNTFDHYVRNGHKIEMWACQIPSVRVTVDVWGTEMELDPQVYTAYETTALEAYKAEAGHYPALSDNSDPVHRR